MRLTKEALEIMKQEEIQAAIERYKNKMKKYGEQALYDQLKKDFGYKDVFGKWKLKEFVEMLKKELEQEM